MSKHNKNLIRGNLNKKKIVKMSNYRLSLINLKLRKMSLKKNYKI